AAWEILCKLGETTNLSKGDFSPLCLPLGGVRADALGLTLSLSCEPFRFHDKNPFLAFCLKQRAKTSLGGGFYSVFQRGMGFLAERLRGLCSGFFNSGHCPH
ncbi:MAG TPA: hypothetical protein DDX91_02535, partial [Ruminococcaceae bacterium]|nr:hypothetical protein [Oscillospiraceae bacterium]